MSYGLQTWDENGNVIFDSTTLISRMRYYTIAPAGQSGSVNLPGLSDHKITYFSFLAEAGDKLNHTLSQSGDTISWSPRSSDNNPSGDSLILIFILD